MHKKEIVVLCNGYSMDDKYGYVGIRDKSSRFFFFAKVKYNHISGRKCCIANDRMLYAQVFFVMSSCKFFMCYIRYNVKDFGLAYSMTRSQNEAKFLYLSLTLLRSVSLSLEFYSYIYMYFSAIAN